MFFKFLFDSEPKVLTCTYQLLVGKFSELVLHFEPVFECGWLAHELVIVLVREIAIELFVVMFDVADVVAVAVAAAAAAVREIELESTAV